MSGDFEVNVSEIEALELRLGSVDLSDRERTLLAGVFALAGRAVVDLMDDEVSGFMPTAVEFSPLNFSKFSGLPNYLDSFHDISVRGGQSAPGGAISSFSWGMHAAGGGGGAG